MEKFEIGQEVEIVDCEATHDWYLTSLIGERFTITKTNLDPEDDGFAVFRMRYVPPEACKLVE